MDGVEGFSEDFGYEAYGYGEGVGCAFEGGYDFAWLEEGRGVEGAVEEMWPCGN
jgi:hypothetical protein